MEIDINQAIFRLFIGAVIGAIVGLEREKSMQVNKEKSPIGIRTDILVGMLGGAACFLSQIISEWIFPIILIAVILIGLLPILQNHNREKIMSYKTSISFILVFLMGALAFYGQVQIALAVTIIATMVLSLKYTLHRFIYGLHYGEIIDAIKFLVIAFIILPFLPNQAFDSQLLGYIEPATRPVAHAIQTNIINPYNIWFLIVIISGLNFLGYILVKLYGHARAFSFTGLLGGLYSSTVTSLNLSTTSKSHPGLIYPFVAGILLACGSSYFKMFVVMRALNAELFERIFWSYTIMAVYLLVSGYIFKYLSEKKNQPVHNAKGKEFIKPKSPLNLKSAMKLAIFVVLTMLVANLILRYSDINLYYTLAALMALLAVDDPIVISTASIAGAGKAIDLTTAKNIIIGVAFLNMIQKILTVYFFGNRKLIKPLALAFGGLLLVTIGALIYL